MKPITAEWLEQIAAEVEKDPTRWTQGTGASEIERLNNLIAEHTQLNSDSICARILALNQRDAAQAEADQLRAQLAALESAMTKLRGDYDRERFSARDLRAQVAALEAEVERLKEPVPLVWEKDGAFFSSGDYVACSTAAWCGELTIWQGIDEGVEAAIAACAAHHLARYREMQGAS